MVRNRPATISTTPPDERGRIGAQSPRRGNNEHNKGNGKPQRTRAQTASGNPNVSDGLLPSLVPVRKLLAPHGTPPQPDPRLPSNARQRPSAAVTPAGTPRAGQKRIGVAQSGGGRSGDLTKPAVRAAPSPGRGGVAAAAAAAEVGSPRRPSGQLIPKKEGSPGDKRQQQQQRFRRKPAAQKDTHVSVNQAETGAGAGRQEADEEDLTMEEVMLLCGVRPGSSKALWFTSMSMQVVQRGAEEASVLLVADAASSPTQPGGQSTTPALTPSEAPRSPVALFSVRPLQLPPELLLPYDRAVNAPSQRRDSAVTVPASTPPLRAAVRPHPSSSMVSDGDREGERKVDESRMNVGAPPIARDAASSSSAEDSEGNDDEDATDSASSEREEEDDDEEEEEGTSSEEHFISSSPRKSHIATKRPVSEAADLLAYLRAAVAHRKSEFPAAIEAAGSPLRLLRPSFNQLQEYRVHVLSLEPHEEI